MKISVIICSYNNAKYLGKAIESVLNQSYKNIELIVIDDASTDNSREILNKYKGKIKVFENTKNMGAAYSRNLGITNATGEYIGFVDSDDYIDDNYYSRIVSKIKDNDIAVTDIKHITKNGIDVYKGFENGSYVNTAYAASSCNKLIRKEYIEKYKYPEGKINEDIAVIIPCLCNTSKIVYVEDVYYNYLENNNSVQNSISFKKFDAFDMVEEAFKRITNVSKDDADAIVYNQLILLLPYLLITEKSFIKRYKLLRRYSKRIKKYNIYENNNFNTFINLQGKLHKIYYNLLFKLNGLGLNLLCNFMISLVNAYSKTRKSVIDDNITLDKLVYLAKKQTKLKERRTVSVVIPNYNYAEFLYQRIYSVLYQNYKITEIILLDDASTDDSKKVLDKIYKVLKPYMNICVCCNDNNSGNVFKQWKKGFEMAKSDYVWIAEADDYCSNKFLSNVMKNITDDVVISYCDTSFINKEGKVIYKSVRPSIDLLDTKHWNKDFINDGIDEIKEYAYLNCTIANVSSVVFKNGKYDNEFSLSSKFRQTGDWLFYLNIMLKGKVMYCNKRLNYYRIHGSNVTSVTKKENHLNEIKKIHDYIDSIICLNGKQKKEIKKRYDYLKKEWNIGG